MVQNGNLRLFSGNSNVGLANGISSYLGVELGEVDLGRFADNEIFVRFQENIRGCDVFLIQTTTRRRRTSSSSSS